MFFVHFDQVFLGFRTKKEKKRKKIHIKDPFRSFEDKKKDKKKERRRTQGRIIGATLI